MANKLIRVIRTEDEDTSTAGVATSKRADEPQLLPIVPINQNTGLPDVLNPVENRIYATKNVGSQEILFVTDNITLGNKNPVTSNAVAGIIDPITTGFETINNKVETLGTTVETIAGEFESITKDFKYTTTETQTNSVWFNNKPIYRACFSGTLNANQNKRLASISYMNSMLVRVEGFCETLTNVYVFGNGNTSVTYSLIQTVTGLFLRSYVGESSTYEVAVYYYKK